MKIFLNVKEKSGLLLINSYSANADMTAMVRQGMLLEDEIRSSKQDPIDYLKTLKPEDLAGLQSIKTLYGKMDANALTKPA